MYTTDRDKTNSSTPALKNRKIILAIVNDRRFITSTGRQHKQIFLFSRWRMDTLVLLCLLSYRRIIVIKKKHRSTILKSYAGKHLKHIDFFAKMERDVTMNQFLKILLLAMQSKRQ